ncbi:RNA 2',3'-cyclic phosphodiesterase [Vibrio ishigakensis]|uniref:RNA 2',3'-cyclic phosphodiesterase n=1 Tax=Vibrio ishigakensis TaxID=1481914 RepID=UPI0021C3EB1B|nr:RNA 2',3'-cyclic phosphodiesterase [Vibrio ishigakensis]
MRLFYALTFDDAVQEEIAQLQELLRAQRYRGRLVRQDNLHLTLDFIGEVKDDGKVEILKQQLLGLPDMPNTLTLAGFGRFKQGLVWARVVEDPSLHQLQSDLRARLINLGFSIEDREYRPHITLGRNLRLKVPVSELNGPEMRVAPKAVALMQSTHLNDRLVYRPVAQILLDKQ